MYIIYNKTRKLVQQQVFSSKDDNWDNDNEMNLIIKYSNFFKRKIQQLISH